MKQFLAINKQNNDTGEEDQCMFNNIIPFWNDPSILNKFECSFLKNALCHVWFNGSGEGDEAVKSLQRQQQERFW